MTSCRAATALVLAALVASACSNPSVPGTGEDPGRPSLVIGAGGAYDSLNPVLGFAPNGASKIFDGLLDHDADLALRPALAAELPQVSTDGLTWTVDLRDDVQFHDGTPLTAQDVVFTYERIVDPQVESTIAAELDAMESVRAVDDDTVEFRLGYPYHPFGQRLTIGIVPRAALEGEDLNSTDFNVAPVGTGPYAVADYREGDRLVLRANEDYYRGAPAIKDVTIVFVVDDNTRAQRMAAGDFDVTVLPPKLAKTYEGRDGFHVISSRTADYRGIGLPNNDFTGDPLVRRAVNLGIDRQAMIDSILAGEGIPAATTVSPFLDDHDPSAAFPYDPQEAGRLLDQAGWTAGPDGKRARDGVPAQLTILYPGPDVLRRELALAAASDLVKLGVDARATSATFEQMLEQSGTAAALWGGGDPYDPDTSSYSLLHSSFAGGDGYVNMTGYRNPAVDAALDAGRASNDPAVRSQAYRAYQKAFVADPGWAFLVFLNHTYVLRGDYGGLRPQVEPHDHGLTHGLWWNLEEWTPASS
jgi:peptide/nickel transport system substrate-binding protein